MAARSIKADHCKIRFDATGEERNRPIEMVQNVAIVLGPMRIWCVGPKNELLSIGFACASQEPECECSQNWRSAPEPLSEAFEYVCLPSDYREPFLVA